MKYPMILEKLKSKVEADQEPADEADSEYLEKLY
jgi:hypothetical protein